MPPMQHSARSHGSARQLSRRDLLNVLVGCSSAVMGQGVFAAAPGLDARMVCYVSVAGEKAIAAHSVDVNTGALKRMQTISVEGVPTSLCVDPHSRFLYAGLASTNSISTLQIDPTTGTLSHVRTIKAVEGPTYLITDRSGHHLLAAFIAGSKVAVYSIQADGTPAERATQVIDTDKHPHSILPDPASRFVVVPHTSADTILQYQLDGKTGTLSPANVPRAATKRGSGPRHGRFHPSRPFVYFVNEKNSTVSVYRIDESGGLVAIQTVTTLPDDFKGSNTCADVEITPCGTYVYVSNRGHDSLAGFTIDEKSGSLKSLGHTATEKMPREFAIDPSGRFLYVAGQLSGRLASYAIARDTGSLRPLMVEDVGKGPVWVLVVRLPAMP